MKKIIPPISDTTQPATTSASALAAIIVIVGAIAVAVLASLPEDTPMWVSAIFVGLVSGTGAAGAKINGARVRDVVYPEAHVREMFYTQNGDLTHIPEGVVPEVFPDLDDLPDIDPDILKGL